LAETELARASADVSRSLRTLEEKMDTFESQKLSTTTSALRSLLRAELALHARELELLTKTYNEMALIDEQQDLEVNKDIAKTYTAIQILILFYNHTMLNRTLGQHEVTWKG
jgi:glycerol-3-phosphate O-acyltransferase